jgi:hypothetical protein
VAGALKTEKEYRVNSLGKTVESKEIKLKDLHIPLSYGLCIYINLLTKMLLAIIKLWHFIDDW